MKKLQIVMLLMTTSFFGLNGFAQEAVPVSLPAPKKQETEPLKKKVQKELCNGAFECQSNLCAVYAEYVGINPKTKEPTVVIRAENICIPVGTPQCKKEEMQNLQHSCWMKVRL